MESTTPITIKIVRIVVVAGVLIYLFKQFENRYFPCERPITYVIGSFDKRFGISKDDFLLAVSEAEQIWEKPLGKPLFTYAAAEGNLKINLIYDVRQEATVALQQLGLTVRDDKASFDALKSKYDVLQADYMREGALFEARVAAFESRRNTYDAEVTYWNKQGGAPQEVYARLEETKNALQAEHFEINQLQTDINAKVEEINALAVVLNRLAASLNLSVAQFNRIGSEHRGEFTEGTYQSGPEGQKIDIYQFDDRGELVRVLTHELGHALGLEHVTNSEAIMYRLNSGVNEKLAADDLAALKAHCKMK